MEVVCPRSAIPAYAIFSGKHPAADVEELATKYRNGPGLRVSEVVDGTPDKLQELIQFATDLSPSSRPVDVAEFLKLLEEVEDELIMPEPEVGKHSLDAKAGDTLSGGFTVVHRLGSGSAAIPERTNAYDWSDNVVVLSDSPDKADRLRQGEPTENLAGLATRFRAARCPPASTASTCCRHSV